MAMVGPVSLSPARSAQLLDTFGLTFLFALELGNMVRSDRNVQAGFPVGPHGRDHVGGSVVMECFLKSGWTSCCVADMDKMDALVNLMNQ